MPPQRPNPYLERKQRPPPPAGPTLFQKARDWTAFFVSITSLLTAGIALRNTLTGPRPYIAGFADESATILRSDQLQATNMKSSSLVLRDETGTLADFPVLVVPITLANRAAPPNGVGVRSIEATLTVAQSGNTLFRGDYFWHRSITSTSTFDEEAKVERYVVKTEEQTAGFDLAGGTTWSREILLIPRQSWAAQSWKPFEDKVLKNCTANCQSEVAIRVKLDNGTSLAETCAFDVDRHLITHLSGQERRYFTLPRCRVRSGI